MVNEDINDWSDDKFKTAANKLKRYPSYNDKIDYAFSLFGANKDCLEHLIHPVERIIGGKKLCFGLKISNAIDANKIGNAISQKFMCIFYEDERKDIDYRVAEKCRSIDDEKELITYELEKIEDRVAVSKSSDYPSNLYYEGYAGEKARKDYHFFLFPHVQNAELPRQHFSINVFYRIGEGASAYHYERYLKGLLNNPSQRSGKYIEKSAENLTPRPMNQQDALELIDPVMINLFLDAEKKALAGAVKFQSKTRCAAFCELLYERKYITNTSTRQKTMSDFAKSRFGISISKALYSNKTKFRTNHKMQKVNGLIPLKNCF